MNISVIDLPVIDVTALDDLARGLDRDAARVAELAARTGGCISESWRGPASEAHQAQVTEHARDLRALAGDLVEAARRVRALREAAAQRYEVALRVAEVAQERLANGPLLNPRLP